MSNILEKKGDNVTRAVNYIDEALKTTDKSVSQLISEAGAKFNLTPKDEEYLTNLFANRKK